MLLFSYAVQTHMTNETSVKFRLSDVLIGMMVPFMAWKAIFLWKEIWTPSLTSCSGENRHYLQLGRREVQICRISVHGIWRAAKERSLSWFLLERTIKYPVGFFVFFHFFTRSSMLISLPFQPVKALNLSLLSQQELESHKLKINYRYVYAHLFQKCTVYFLPFPVFICFAVL